MKQLQLCFAFLLAVTFLNAQRDRTLFNGNNRHGAFGAPIFDYYNLNSDGNIETASGGGGALILGDFFIGGYGIGDIDLFEIIDNDRADIDLAHGGLWFGATPLQQYAVHPYMSVRLGWGAADIVIDDDNFNYGDRFMVVSPEVGVEVNVFRWFRLAGTVGYQWYDGIENIGNSDLDLDNLRAGLTLRFGAFGRNRRNDHW